MTYPRPLLATALAVSALTSPAAAQNFTSAAEVQPILAATKSAWIAVREFDGQDLVYFTHLLSWRCGLSEIRAGVNGQPLVALAMEPCHTDTAQPNALVMDTLLPYVVMPLGSVQSVSVEVTFDDGTKDTATFPRKAVLMP